VIGCPCWSWYSAAARAREREQGLVLIVPGRGWPSRLPPERTSWRPPCRRRRGGVAPWPGRAQRPPIQKSGLRGPFFTRCPELDAGGAAVPACYGSVDVPVAVLTCTWGAFRPVLAAPGRRAGAGALAPGWVAGRLPVPCARAGARVTARQAWGRRGNVRGRARRPWAGRFPASPLTRFAAGLLAAEAEDRRPGSRSRDRGRSAEPADRLARHANLSLLRTAS
jgi:hypothetical protein